MPLVLTHQDDSALSGITLIAERAIPSGSVDLKILNTGSEDVIGAFLTLYAEPDPGSGIYSSTGHPATDERMGRFQITGQDSSATPGQQIVLGVVQPMGHLAVAFLPTIKPGNWIEANFWIEQSGSSAGGGAVNIKLEVANQVAAHPLPFGVSQVGNGIDSGVRQPRSFYINARAVTTTGTPDDEVHAAAGEWLIQGEEYEDATIQDIAFDQDDGNSDALAAGEVYVAVLTQGINAAPTVTKGEKAVSGSEERPTPPAGELLLAWVTVAYNATSTVIAPGDVENARIFGRYKVSALPTGLSVTVHPGEAVIGGFWQLRGIAAEVALTASVTNRIWLEWNGDITVNTSDVPPSAGAVKLAEAITDGSAVTSLTDTRRYIQGSNSGVLEVEALGGSPNIPSVTKIIFPLGAVTDNGGGEVEIDLAAGDLTKADKSTGLTGTEGVARTSGTDLSTAAQFKLAVSTLTADASPDGAADYVATWDASAGVHKKVLLDDLPGGGGGGSGFTTDEDDLVIADGQNDDVALPVSSASFLWLQVQGVTTSATITGIEAQDPGTDQIVVLFVEGGSGPITINHVDTDSAADARIICPGAINLLLGPLDSAVLQYHRDFEFWTVIAVNRGGASMIVGDGSTTVNPCTEIEFTSGATVTDAGSGKAEIAVAGGGGGGGGEIKWKVGTVETLLTTELDSLANATGCALGPEFDNGDAAARFLFGDFVLTMGAGGTMTAGTSVDLFLVPATDGAVYNDGGVAAQPPNFFKGAWIVAAATSAILTIQGLPLPPCKFKIFVVNRTGQGFNSSGNTVEMLPYGYEVV